MSADILSLAFVDPTPGREAECEAVLKRIGEVLVAKDYGRDDLYRDEQEPHELVITRYWRSAEARMRAQEDPDLHRLWRELAELCTVRKVYEQLTRVEIQRS